METSPFYFEAIGTKWRIDVYQELPSEKGVVVIDAIKKRIDIFDKNYSRFRADSWVTKLSEEPGTYELPPDAKQMFDIYKELYDITGGLMTPLIGQVLVDAGYDSDYTLHQTKPLSEPLTWNEALEYQPPFITIKKPVLLDFGACGKGYLIDIVGEVLEEYGITHYCVDAGGDILHKDALSAPLRIGLEVPSDLEKAIGVITLPNKSIAGSAGNRRRWKNFHHIINPATLTSPENILGVWAVADSAVLADAMTTALYFCKAETLLKHFTFDYLILYADRSVKGNLLQSSMLELYV